MAYLDDVDLELDAARRLIENPPNRFAAFHLQQAAEKLVKAARLGHGLRINRYPSPTGKRKGGPDNDEILVWIKTIAGLSAEARIAFAGS